MTSFNLSDYDDKALATMFEIVKTSLIKKLESKVLELSEFKSSDCCSITVNKLAELKRDGGVEWNQLTRISQRIVARRKQKELDALNESIDFDEDLTQGKEKAGGDGKGAGGKGNRT